MLAAFAGLTLSASAASKWDGYQKISSANDLNRLKGSSGKFYLTKDIDLKDVTWENYFEFKGTLDGNGYAIKNLTSSKCGLFSYLENAEIRNLGLVNVKINNGYGGAAAMTMSARNTSFENCYVSGSVKSTSSMAAGFSLGSAGGNTYTNCVNLADITSGSSAAAGFEYSLAWSACEDVYKNCINYGKISGRDIAVGICTYLGTTMESCYNAGTVTITTKNDVGYSYFAGGLVGRGTNNAEMKNCATVTETDVGYFENGCTAQADTEASKSDFKKEATFKGFDFKKVWTIDSKTNSGYAVLQTMVQKSSSASNTTPEKKYSSVKVQLSTDIKGGEIRYTTDGKAPTASSKKYTSAISLTKTTNIKAAVFVNGKKQTGSNAQVYYKIVIA